MSEQVNPYIEQSEAWNTPLFFSRLQNHDQVKEQVLSYINQYVAAQHQAVESEVALNAKRNLFESELNFFESGSDELQKLVTEIKDHLLLAVSGLNYDYWVEDAEPAVNITESWFHVTENGGYHDVHSHPNCSWCGIYCLDPGDSNIENASGVNRFYDPRIHAAHYLDAGNLFLHQEGYWDVAPVEGQLVLFPSYLKHSALPYFGEKNRVVLAFNATIEI
jgi:uncharacterized protein (TIGR02466 family)